MVNLGVLYDNGQGVAQDYAKAREWYEKAADKGDASDEATSRYNTKLRSWSSQRRTLCEALQLQEASAMKVGEAETKHEGKPGRETAKSSRCHGTPWRTRIHESWRRGSCARARSGELNKLTGRTHSCSWDAEKNLKRSTLPTKARPSRGRM